MKFGLLRFNPGGVSRSTSVLATIGSDYALCPLQGAC
jgi:hypothetical protein